MPGGRPTDYNDEIVAKAWEYLCSDSSINYESHGHAIPSVVGLCRILNRARTTLYHWEKLDDNEFKHILPACKELQEFVLINGTLKNDLNSNIGKLVLGKHGYHDKQDTNVTGTLGLTDLSESDLDRKIRQLESLNEQSTKD